MQNKSKISKILIDKGLKLFQKPAKRKVDFSNHAKSDKLISNLKQYPHAFVLACVMDRQIKAERAWLIPYKVSQEIDGFKFSKLLKFNRKDVVNIFKKKKLHRFNDLMAKYFYLAIQKIHKDYQNNVSKIWSDRPRSATVVRKFLEFEGVGIKIATMATNILARDFKIPMKDHICIDISPDIHVIRVFKRIGFISKKASNDELIYKAREIYPQYPGVLDLPIWEIGRNWCKFRNPKCKDCYLNNYCEKDIKIV